VKTLQFAIVNTMKMVFAKIAAVAAESLDATASNAEIVLEWLKTQTAKTVSLATA
jgi:hypothetical protein